MLRRTQQINSSIDSVFTLWKRLFPSLVTPLFIRRFLHFTLCSVGNRVPLTPNVTECNLIILIVLLVLSRVPPPLVVAWPLEIAPPGWGRPAPHIALCHQVACTVILQPSPARVVYDYGMAWLWPLYLRVSQASTGIIPFNSSRTRPNKARPLLLNCISYPLPSSCITIS